MPRLQFLPNGEIMIYLSSNKPVHSQSFGETLRLLGISNSFVGRRYRTPAEDRIVGTLLTACRLGRSVVVHNLNEDVCVIFQGAFVKLERQQRDEWAAVPYSFAFDPFADLKERIRRLPK